MAHILNSKLPLIKLRPIQTRHIKSGLLVLLALFTGWLTGADITHVRMFPSADQTLFSQHYPLAVAAPLSQAENSPLNIPLSSSDTGRSQLAQPGQSPLNSPLNPISRQGENAQSPLELPSTATIAPTDAPLPTATALPTEEPTPTETPEATAVPTDTPEPTLTPRPVQSEETDLPSNEADDGYTPEEIPDAASRSLAESDGPVPEINPQPAIESAVVTQSGLEGGSLNVNPLDALLTMESLILGLLCLIFISINGLGLSALIVTMLYIRSRREQPYS